MGHSFSRAVSGGQDQSSQSTSSNQAYPFLQSALSGVVGQGAGAGSQIANMLGLGGAGAQGTGFDNWKNSTGYQFGLDQGTQAITGNAATKGLLNSGGTLKALNTFGQDYASTKSGDYMNQLQGLLGSGIQGANTIGGAGQVANSTSKGSSDKGAGGFVGSLLGKG